MRRLFPVVLAVALLAIPLPAQAGAAGTLAGKINAERTARGLPALEVSGTLAAAAAGHASRMRDEGRIFHNPGLGSITSGWEAMGENVGAGPDIASVHAAFMGSSVHRANVLGDWTHVGVGVAEGDDGTVWVAVVFMRALGATETTTTTTSTTTVPPPVATTTVPPTTTTTVAPPPAASGASRDTAPAALPAPSSRGDASRRHPVREVRSGPVTTQLVRGEVYPLGPQLYAV